MNPLQLAKDLLFPRLCSACVGTLNPYESHICINCNLSLPKIDLNENDLNKKFWGKLDIKNTYSFLEFSKNSKVQNILHNLKYKNKPDLAEFMGKWFGKDLLSIGFDKEIDLLLAIPLHPIKEKRRGYNQANHIAIGIAEKTGVSFDPKAISRTQFTETQTNKSRFGRFKNMEGVFKVEKPEIIQGKRVGLVDDVLTTGATLEVAGYELLKVGCKELSIITLAAAL